MKVGKQTKADLIRSLEVARNALSSACHERDVAVHNGKALDEACKSLTQQLTDAKVDLKAQQATTDIARAEVSRTQVKVVELAKAARRERNRGRIARAEARLYRECLKAIDWERKQTDSTLKNPWLLAAAVGAAIPIMAALLGRSRTARKLAEKATPSGPVAVVPPPVGSLGRPSRKEAAYDTEFYDTQFYKSGAPGVFGPPFDTGTPPK